MKIPWIQILILLAIVAIATGCGVRPLVEPPAPAPGVGDQLRSLGTGFIQWGGISLGLGVLAGLVLWFGGLAAGGWAISLIRLSASIGAGSLAIGAAFTWLAMYLWVVVLVCIATAVAIGWYHRRGLRRWFDRWVGHKTAVPKP